MNKPQTHKNDLQRQTLERLGADALAHVAGGTTFITRPILDPVFIFGGFGDAASSSGAGTSVAEDRGGKRGHINVRPK